MVASLLEVPDHIKSPDSVELNVSGVDDSRIGAFCVWPIAKGTEFGPYKGKLIYKNDVDPKYSWDVYDLKSLQYLHTINATDPADGNWMRYVCCARFFEEQNIVSTQKEDQVFYKALKEILPGEELLTWFQPKRKVSRRQSVRIEQTASQNAEDDQGPDKPNSSPGKQKRKRKPKIIPDSYEGPLDFDLRKSVKPKSRGDDEFEPLLPGQKRRRRKKVESDARSSSSMVEPPTPDCESSDMSVFQASLASEPASPNGDEDATDPIKVSAAVKKRDCTTATISEINDAVEWTYPVKGQEFIFEVKDYHIVTKHKKKVYRCDICLGLYKHMFSLKRHYLRNHINYKYLSKADMVNCLINLAQVKLNMETRQTAEEKSPEDECEMEDDTEAVLPEARQVNGAGTDITENEVKQEPETEIKDEVTNMDEDAKQNDQSETLNTSHKDENSCDSNNVLKDKCSEETRGTNDEVVNIKSEELMSTEISGETVEDKTKEGTDTSDISEESSKSTDLDAQAAVDANEKSDKCESDEIEKTVTSNGEVAMETEDTEDVLNEESDNLLCLETLNSSNEEFEEVSATTAETDEKVQDIDKAEIKSEDAVCKDVDDAGDAVDTGGDGEADLTGLYQCYTCYQVFDCVADIREHVQNHPESSDSNCFPCDQCNMMFKFKQNLIRHKKVHEDEDVTSGNELASSSIMTLQSNSLAGRKKQKDTVTDFITHDHEAIDQVQTYRCDKCKNTFPSLSVLMKHVQTEHKSGSKFQCQYCGKDFLSLPNMKKHVRFHLGYRASCRYCSENFPNVGALRRHTRLVHPEHHKTKLLDKTYPISNISSGSQKGAGVSSSVIKETSEKAKLNTIEGKPESKPYKEGYLYAHGVSFTADEIDDGGSRFKFSCTVCKKRFSNYVNMCRHRRKVHNDKPRELLSLDISRKGSNSSPVVIEDPVEVAQFYANVSHNIAVNLNVYIDGKSEVLSNYTDYIKIENYRGLACEAEEKADAEEEEESVDVKPLLEDKPSVDKTSSESEDIVNLCWEDYNFPPNYRPAEVVPVIKGDTCAVNSSEKVAEETDSVKEIPEEIEDLESEVDKQQNMGRSSASLGLPTDNSNMQKTSKYSLSNGRLFQKLRIFDGKLTECQSPASKNFDQVLNGEYANFENDLLPSDVDSPIIERSGSVSSTRSRSNTIKDAGSPLEVSGSDEETDYNAAAQNELAALYAEIDSPDSEEMCSVQTLKSLSQLCEEVLGLDCNSRKPIAIKSPREDSSLLAKLLLTANKKAGYITAPNKAENSLPDFSDEQDDSPFYNYESIAFGRNGEIERVCAICRHSFQDVDSLARHHWKKHPTSVFNFLEVEQGNDIEDLHYSEPSPTGALAVSDPGLECLNDMESFRCTLCGNVFKSINKLHVHIINCSPIDPVFGVFKSDRSPGKNFMKKKLHKKYPNLFQGDIRKLKSKHSSFGDTAKSQNRVFIGCRKRTSMLLPDSPSKTYLELIRQTQEASTGYNPHNHVRRRELTQLVDTLTCEGCGLKFKTIILLERHVKNCTKKEKFKNVKPMTCPIMDESLAKIKNICFYCGKNFTYTKSLVNHFQDFCLVKKSKLDKGDLTEEEKQREKEVLEKLNKQQEEEKSPKDAETDLNSKARKHWQVGRRPKRKGNAWTSIKKRKVPLVRKSTDNESSTVFENVAEEDDEDDVDQEDEDNDTNSFDGDNLDEAEQKEENDVGVDEAEKIVEDPSKHVIKAKPSETSRNNMFVFPVKNGQIDQCGVIGKKEVEEIQEIETEQSRDSCVQLPFSNVKIKEEKKDEEIELNQEEDKQTEIKPESESKQHKSDNVDVVHPVADVKVETECSERTTEKDKSRTNDLHNTSLECTARYKVNVVTLPKLEKEKELKAEVAANTNSVLFQCIAKQTDEDGGNLESDVNELSSKKVDSSLMVEGKRKRARVSKVEEFIRNTFRRKRSRKDPQDKKFHSDSAFVNGQTSNKTSVQLNAVLNETGEPELMKKRRGRPPKEEKVQPTPYVPSGRKVGRPPKYRSPEPTSDVKEISDSADTDKVSCIKKPGRPPKVKPAEEEKASNEKSPEPEVTGKFETRENVAEACQEDKTTPETELFDDNKPLSGELIASVEPELQNGGEPDVVQDAEVPACEDTKIEDVKVGDSSDIPSKIDTSNESGKEDTNSAILCDKTTEMSTDKNSNNTTCDKIASNTQLDDIGDSVCSDEVDGDVANKKTLLESEAKVNDHNKCVDITELENESCKLLLGNEASDNVNINEKDNIEEPVEAEVVAVEQYESPQTNENLPAIENQDQELNHAPEEYVEAVETVIIDTTCELSEEEAAIEENRQNEVVAEAEVKPELSDNKETDTNESDTNTINEEFDMAKSPENIPTFMLGTIMSPGERVKMNKRSCKKDVDIRSPVWVRRSSKPKSKLDNKMDVPNNEDTGTNSKGNMQVKANVGKSLSQKGRNSADSAVQTNLQQSNTRSVTVRNENVTKEKSTGKDSKSGLSKLRKVFDKTQNNLSAGSLLQASRRGTSGSLKRKLPVEESSVSDAKISKKK